MLNVPTGNGTISFSGDAGSQCFVLPHASVLGVDMPGAESERRSFDVVFHGHNGETLYELKQVDIRDLPAWGDYMVRDCFVVSLCSI